MTKLALLGLLLLPLGLQAAEVHKCTDQSGRISFSQTPCPPGDKAELLEVKPIETIAPQAANPEDLRYLEDYDQRRREEQKRKAEEAEKRRAEKERLEAERRKEAEAERRHQETLDAIRSQPVWIPGYSPYHPYHPYPRVHPGQRPWRY